MCRCQSRSSRTCPSHTPRTRCRLVGTPARTGTPPPPERRPGSMNVTGTAHMVYCRARTCSALPRTACTPPRRRPRCCPVSSVASPSHTPTRNRSAASNLPCWSGDTNTARACQAGPSARSPRSRTSHRCLRQARKSQWPHDPGNNKRKLANLSRQRSVHTLLACSLALWQSLPTAWPVERCWGPKCPAPFNPWWWGPIRSTVTPDTASPQTDRCPTGTPYESLQGAFDHSLKGLKS